MRLISITKPGIILGNVITVSGGFFLGSQGPFDFSLFILTLLGISFIIATGCVLNNYIDRDIDLLMERTKSRALAVGLISGRVALLLALLLGILGTFILYFGANPLTAAMGLIGLFFYVAVYTLGLKRKSVYGTTIGGIAGAIPPVVGYCAATNRLDLGALLVFLILFFWQMPHFYAIAIYRLQDFKAASIPVLPLKKGVHYTKLNMLFYVAVFTITALLPAFLGYAGVAYFIVALVLNLVWFYLSWQGLKVDNDRLWARRLFLYSILVITVLSMMMMT